MSEAQVRFESLVHAVEHGLDAVEIQEIAQELCDRLTQTCAAVVCTAQQRLSLEGYAKQRSNRAGTIDKLLALVPMVTWIASGDLLIERRSLRSESTFQVWELVVEGTSYGTTRQGEGKVWGLAHTRVSPTPLDGRAAIEWEVEEQQRAVKLMANARPELAGAMAEGVYRGCGTILLSGDPGVRAARAAAGRVPGE